MNIPIEIVELIVIRVTDLITLFSFYESCKHFKTFLFNKSNLGEIVYNISNSVNLIDSDIEWDITWKDRNVFDSFVRWYRKSCYCGKYYRGSPSLAFSKALDLNHEDGINYYYNKIAEGLSGYNFKDKDLDKIRPKNLLVFFKRINVPYSCSSLVKIIHKSIKTHCCIHKKIEMCDDDRNAYIEMMKSWNIGGYYYVIIEASINDPFLFKLIYESNVDNYDIDMIKSVIHRKIFFHPRYNHFINYVKCVTITFDSKSINKLVADLWLDVLYDRIKLYHCPFFNDEPDTHDNYLFESVSSIIESIENIIGKDNIKTKLVTIINELDSYRAEGSRMHMFPNAINYISNYINN